MAKFIGKNTEFTWFCGVVEDRHDPIKTGRLRVRCLGFHTENKSLLTTADLPWATVMLSTQSPGISGLGTSPSFLVEGSWVWGYFRDSGHQEPIVCGSLPGKPKYYGNPDVGFNDPIRRSEEDIEDKAIEDYGADNEDDDNYHKSVYPRNINETDTNRLAVHNTELEHGSLTARVLNRLDKNKPGEGWVSIATADFDLLTAADGSEILASDSTSWSEPKIQYDGLGVLSEEGEEITPHTYNAVYPYNHVFESESGHIKEFDDSYTIEIIDGEEVRTNYYRIHERHTSGTSYEMTNNGDLVTKVANDNYQLIAGTHNTNIKGNSDITINGRHKIFINKDGEEENNYDIHVGKNANINIQVDQGDINMVTKDGRINVNAGGDYNVKVGGNYTILVEGNKQEDVAGTKTSNTTGAVTHRGATIDLNP